MESFPRRPASGVAAQRACDECRTRKIRCDRVSPCSPCRAAGLTCRTTSQRPKELGDRIQVTKHYENKIDRIDSRLANIEQLLQQSSTIGQTPASSHMSNTQLSYATNISHLEDDSNAQNSPTGDIGLRGESLAAKNVLEQTVGQDYAIQQDPQLRSALESLRGIVNRTQLDASSPSRNLTAASLGRSELEAPFPDWEQVKKLLERAEKTRPMTFNLLSPASFDDFCRKCRYMYEQGQEGSPTDKLLVYSGMSNICSEFSGIDDGSSADYNYNLTKAFSDLLMRALASFPMLMPASMNAVEALLAATLTTIGMCKPSLSWSLSCTVARMCQTLGYNRLSRIDPNVDPMFNRKVMLFWGIFIMDRNNSIRLGHAPAIQDYDIDTPMVTTSDGYPPAIIALIQFWVECGRVQGKICTQLYGPAALSLAPEERARLAEAVADELEQIHQRKIKADSEIMSISGLEQNSNDAQLWIYGDNIMHLSNLTTALYAIPSNHPHRFRAIEAARECLRISRHISNNYRDNIYNLTSYCHWVLLHTPLTPFTGIFCNITANPQTSQEDLRLLEDFVASLQPARRLSDGIEKFYQLCSIFVKVAQAYVRAKAQQQFTNNSDVASGISSQVVPSAIDEFDEHLSVLGFFGRPTMATKNEMSLAEGGEFNDMTVNDSEQQQQFLDISSLHDWHLPNFSLYGLLEQDLNELNQTDFGSYGDATGNS